MELKEFTNLLNAIQEMELPISDTVKGKQVQQTFRNNLTVKLLEALYKDCEQGFLGDTEIVPYLVKGGVILEVPNNSVADSLGANDLGSGALSIELNVTIKNLDADAKELADDYAFKLEVDRQKKEKAEKDKQIQIEKTRQLRELKNRQRNKLAEALEAIKERN